MPSKKNKATEPSQPSTPRSFSKRRISISAENPDAVSTPPKRSKSNITDLISSQGSIESPSDAVKKRLVTTETKSDSQEQKSTEKITKPKPTSDMYTFAQRPRPNGIIDLTETKSPLSKPLNCTRTFGQIGQGGPKRLVVKNLRTTPKADPRDYFERKWKEQANALDSLFQNGDVKILLEELYKSTEHICRQGYDAELFGRLKGKCTAHLHDTVRPQLVQICKSQEQTTSLQAFVDLWALWQKQLKTIRHIYSHLNQTYLIKQGHGDINTVGMHIFRSALFNDKDIRSTVLEATVSIVQQDRQDAASDSLLTLLRGAIDNFHDLAVYTSDFEPVLLKASKEWFRIWRKDVAEEGDLPHYVRSCSKLLEKELRRCDDMSLDRSTRMHLSQMFDEIMIEENVERLCNEDSILDMLEQDLDTELEQCWTLISRKEHQQRLRTPFAKFTESEGSVIVFDEKRESEMVIRLLVFKRRLDHLHVDCFGKDDNMGNTLHQAFETFMNKSKKSQANWDTDNAKPGEMIAKHIDLLLKGGVKAVPKLATKQENVEGGNEQDFDEEEDEDASIETHLADALDLFRFVHGKAVFEAFYKKDLARRLLMGRTQSFDAERSMLTRLRNECGANFTHNLESMFKDMDLARDEMKSYTQLLADREIKPLVEVSVNVLSVAAWPTYAEIPANLPTSIIKAQYDFEKYFKEKHTGRKLTWKPLLAHCQLKARFARGVKELVVSGFQAIVLLLFNDVATGDSLSYDQIKQATGLPDAEIKRTLQSLACAKYKVLTKNPKGRDVNETDTFSFNEKFTDPRFRVKINQIQLKETKEENKETHQRVAADRHYETQAAIVRIMKAHKRIGHNELIVEVIKATRSRGVLDQADIKKNIEKLIEKDYMEREDEIRGYSYLA